MRNLLAHLRLNLLRGWEQDLESVRLESGPNGVISPPSETSLLFLIETVWELRFNPVHLSTLAPALRKHIIS